MNRIETAKPVGGPVKPPVVPPASLVTAGKFSLRTGDGGCSLFTPLHYEANYAYPLLVWLHGPADSEQQLLRIMPLVSLRNYAAVGVRGTQSIALSDGRHAYNWSQSSADVGLAEQSVFDAIDLARRKFHLHPRRIFLAGFDTGGTMAFRLAMSHPSSFAGVLSLGGEFPGGHTPLARLPDARRVPIFLAVGRHSQRYPTARVCEQLKLFHTAGMAVALRQYPCGQEIDTHMLADMDRWIMEQVTGQPALHTG